MTDQIALSKQRLRLRTARGPERPRYFNDAGSDHAIFMLLAIMSEVSALADRLDTHEKLADDNRLPSRSAVENFASTMQIDEDREERRQKFIKRVMRSVTEIASERSQ